MVPKTGVEPATFPLRRDCTSSCATRAYQRVAKESNPACEKFGASPVPSTRNAFRSMSDRGQNYATKTKGRRLFGLPALWGLILVGFPLGAGSLICWQEAGKGVIARLPLADCRPRIARNRRGEPRREHYCAFGQRDEHREFKLQEAQKHVKDFFRTISKNAMGLFSS